MIDASQQLIRWFAVYLLLPSISFSCLLALICRIYFKLKCRTFKNNLLYVGTKCLDFHVLFAFLIAKASTKLKQGLSQLFILSKDYRLIFIWRTLTLLLGSQKNVTFMWKSCIHSERNACNVQYNIEQRQMFLQRKEIYFYMYFHIASLIVVEMNVTSTQCIVAL